MIGTAFGPHEVRYAHRALPRRVTTKMRSLAFVGGDERELEDWFADHWSMLGPEVRRKWAWRTMPLEVVDTWKDWPVPAKVVQTGQAELAFMKE